MTPKRVRLAKRDAEARDQPAAPQDWHRRASMETDRRILLSTCRCREWGRLQVLVDDRLSRLKLGQAHEVLIERMAPRERWRAVPRVIDLNGRVFKAGL